MHIVTRNNRTLCNYGFGEDDEERRKENVKESA